MARTFEAEVRAALAGDDELVPTGPRSGFFASVDGAPADGYRAPQTAPTVGRVHRAPETGDESRCAVITGELGAQVLEPLLDELPGQRATASGEEHASSAGTSASPDC